MHPIGNPARILSAVLFHLQPREVIHCLQRQGSPAAASKRCKLRPRRHFEPGGAADGGPFFLPSLKHMAISISNYWRDTRAPRYSLTFALPLLVAYEVLAFSLSHDEWPGSGTAPTCC